MKFLSEIQQKLEELKKATDQLAQKQLDQKQLRQPQPLLRTDGSALMSDRRDRVVVAGRGRVRAVERSPRGP